MAKSPSPIVRLEWLKTKNKNNEIIGDCERSN